MLALLCITESQAVLHKGIACQLAKNGVVSANPRPLPGWKDNRVVSVESRDRSNGFLVWNPSFFSSSLVRLQTLLPAASLLQLNGVRDACCKFLLSQLDPSNCLGIRGFADTHSCSDLLKSAHKYVLQHFVEVSKTEEFMLLPLKQVGGVLTHTLS